jgi:hypothetical protein
MARKITVSVNVEDDIHKRIKAAAVTLGTTIEKIYDQSLRGWLSGDAPARYPYLEKNRDLHEKLEAILNSDDDVADVARSNIRVFYDRRTAVTPTDAALESEREAGLRGDDPDSTERKPA